LIDGFPVLFFQAARCSPLLSLLSLLLLLLADAVEELKSQLSAERKQNTELKQMIESLLASQQKANMQLAFYEEDQGNNVSRLCQHC